MLSSPLARPRTILLLAQGLLVASCGLDEFPQEGERPRVSEPTASSNPTGSSEPTGPRPMSGARDAGVDAPRDAASATGQKPDARNAPSTDDPVVINGVPMPKEKVIVFLHLGHSNMAGRTDTPVGLRPFFFETHPRLWSFKQGWKPAKEPLSGDFLTRGRAGPGMAILRTALGMAEPDAVMVSIGHGQDGSRGGKCASYRRGGLLYEVIMGPAKQLRGKVTFGAIFSVLVLMDVFGDKQLLPRAHECHEAVARDMRADLGDPNIPFLMSDWEMGATDRFDPDLPDAVVARAQLRIAQKNIPRSAIIPTDMLPMSDNHHFDLTGYKLWAERAFDLIKEGGWGAWISESR
jgi:hypothetical protein